MTPSSASLRRALDAALRSIPRLLRASPAASVLAGTILLVSILSRFGGLDTERLEARAEAPERVWALLLGLWSTPTWHAALALGLGVLVIGGLFEAAMGSRRWLASLGAAAIGGVLVVQATHAVLLATGSMWGEAQAGHAPLSVALFGLAGVSAAGSWWMNRLGRRRLLSLLFALLLILVAFAGSPQGVGALAGALIGTALGLLMGPKGAERRSLIGTRHRGRSTVSLVALTLSAGTALAAWSAHAVGPLSAAALGLITPGDLTADALSRLCASHSQAVCERAVAAAKYGGIEPMLLVLMPFAVQSALAWGLARGRRAAAVGTVILQAAIALFGLARVSFEPIVFEIDSGTPIPSQIELPDVPLGRLLIPVLVPLSTVALIVWNRSWFTVRTTRHALRRAAVTALGASIGIGALVLLIGLASPESTVPASTPFLLLANFVARLLPPSALVLLTPTLLPATWVGSLLIEWAPIAVWLTWALEIALAVASTPELEDASSAKSVEAKEFVRAVGAGSLGWMLTWPGNQRWLDEDGSALVTYRSTSGVALTISDPAARPGGMGNAVQAFADFATSRALIPALYSVHADAARAARELGWTSIRVAEEAIVDLPGLAFTGKKFQDVRTAINRAGKEGIRAEWTNFRTCPEGVRDQIRAISNAWADEKALPEMGFTLGSLAEIDDDDTRLLLAIDEDGTVHAVTSWLPVYKAGELIGLTLDVMRRRDHSFRPVIEFLIGTAALAARDEGLQILSLSGAPLARSGLAPEDSELDSSAAQRFAPILDQVGALLEPVYGFRSLLFFKKKFQPRFEPLYLVVPDVLDVPAVGVAIGRAYLPDMGPIDAARFTRKLMSDE